MLAGQLRAKQRNRILRYPPSDQRPHTASATTSSTTLTILHADRSEAQGRWREDPVGSQPRCPGVQFLGCPAVPPKSLRASSRPLARVTPPSAKILLPCTLVPSVLGRFFFQPTPTRLVPNVTQDTVRSTSSIWPLGRPMKPASWIRTIIYREGKE